MVIFWLLMEHDVAIALLAVVIMVVVRVFFLKWGCGRDVS